ncbi:MAG: glycosyltransferase [Ilumatobacteraceae bacterium]|nr:glycosyltransferase [Ilumatobacteraceae bacterium]
MRILFVHEVNWLEKVTYEIHDIPELLSIAGHEVSFIDFPEFSKADSRNHRFSFRTTRNLAQSRAHIGSKVDVLTPGAVVGGGLSRYFASLTFVPLFWRTARARKIDLVVLYGVPTNGWQTVFLSKILKIPVIFRAIDIAHLLRETKFKSLVKLAERYIYRNVDHISAHNDALKNYCIEMGAAPARVSIDFPRFDFDRFKPFKRDEDLALSLGIKPDQKVVFFRGTLYRFAGLELFVNLFSNYLRNNPDVCFLIVGSGEAESTIREKISKLGLEKQVILRPFVSYDELVRYICLADVSVNTFIPSLVTHCVLPGRVLQSIACGVPVVSTPLHGMMSYSKGSDTVIYRELDASFVDAVIDLLNNPTKSKEIGLASRELVISKGTWPDFVAEFSSLAQNLIATR